VRAWCDPRVIHLSLKRADLAFSPARPGEDALPPAALRPRANRAVIAIMRRWLELALVRLSQMLYSIEINALIADEY
jgi:hypothetical protein